MKKQGVVAGMFVLAVLIAVAAGCGLDQEQAVYSGIDTALGDLVLKVEKPMQMLTIAPDVQMETSFYNVTGYGPAGETFHLYEVVPPGPTLSVTVEDLVIGEWTIVADGINPDGYVIARGQDTVVVSPGGVVEAQITVEPLPGPGELNVAISWPANLVSQPGVDATLAPVGESPYDIVFDVTDNTAAYVSVPPLEAGYYALTVQLKDADVVVWGAVEAVRILAGWTSEGEFPLTEQDINQAGGDIDIVIDPDLQNPIDIVLDGVQDLLVVGDSMTVTSSTDPPDPMDGSYQYQWYLNGAAIAGATGASVTIEGSALDPGNYRLDLLIAYQDTLSSTNARFEVVEPVSTNGFTVTVQYPTTDHDGRSVYVSTYPVDGNVPSNNAVETQSAVFTGNTATIELSRSGAGYEDGTYQVRAHIDANGDGELSLIENADFLTLKQRTIDGASVSVTLNGPWGTYVPFLVFNTPPSLVDLTGILMYLYLVEQGDAWGSYSYASNAVAADSGAVPMDSWGTTSGTLYNLIAVIDMNGNFPAVGGPDAGDYVYTGSSVFLSNGKFSPENQIIDEVQWVLQ